LKVWRLVRGELFSFVDARILAIKFIVMKTPKQGLGDITDELVGLLDGRIFIDVINSDGVRHTLVDGNFEFWHLVPFYISVIKVYQAWPV
jgi:hypothetical protein